MKEDDPTYVFDEPRPTGGNCRVEVKRSAIIEHMKRTYEGTTLSDEELVQNFVTVNWAWKKEES